MNPFFIFVVVASIGTIAAAIPIIQEDNSDINSTGDHSINDNSQNNSARKRRLPHEFMRISIINDTILNLTMGKPFELVCEASGSPPPSIKWYHNKKLVSSAVGYPEQNEIEEVAVGVLKSRLRFDCLMPHHEGEYMCEATVGSKVRTTFPHKINVRGNLKLLKSRAACTPAPFTPPRILSWGSTLLEFMGRDAVLPCVAVGNPTPSISWVDSDGNAIPTDASSRFKLLSNGALFISNLTWADMGMYECVAQNSYGTDFTDAFLYPTKLSDDDAAKE